MTKRLRRTIAVGFGASVLSLALPLMATAGGGGNSSTPRPSASASRIDPVVTYREGVERFKAGDYAAAEKILKRATSAARRDPNMHYMLGLSQMAQDKWKPATKSFNRALKYNGELHDARAELAISLLRRGKAEEALSHMAAFEAHLADCGEACTPALMAAADKLRTALSGKPTELGISTFLKGDADGDFAYLDAVRLINLGRFEAAKTALYQASARFGPHPDILTYLGFAHRKSGDYDTAVAYYSAALQVDPNHLSANEYLGEYYVERGELSKAKAQLARLEDLCVFGCAQVDELQYWIARAER